MGGDFRHHRQESFDRELEVYRRLRRLRINRVLGFTVPKLRGSSSDVKVIRMDVVRPPFLLDFAGVLFSPPDFPEMTLAHWHQEIADRYGPNAPLVYSVYNALAAHDLYYVDFRHSNLNLKDHPDAIPVEPPHYEDL
jgi:hypothetical protein